MGDRRQMVRRVSAQLGDRSLYWGGLRSDDVEALGDVPQLARSLSIIGGHDRPTVVPSTDFEHLWGSRMDLDAWDIDDHLDHPAVLEFRNEILGHLLRPSALIVYRPTRFLSSIAFSRRDRCRYLGLFSEHQMAFDHKPWVESSLRESGLPGLNWTYVANEERRRVERMVEQQPLMLRPSRTSGGVGLVLLKDPSEVETAWPHQPDAFAGVAPYLKDSVPVNVGATVWTDGRVTLGHPSVQLIGLSVCTDKPFGYCGNDFGAIRDLGTPTVDALDRSTRVVGKWLAKHGFVGSFGVDFLVHEGEPLFTEVNPRFQGSTHASCRLSIEAGESCLMLDHLAALLGLSASHERPLRDLVRGTPDLASVVIHSQVEAGLIEVKPVVDRLRRLPSHVRTDVQAHPTLVSESGSTLLRTMFRSRCTTNGFDLLAPLDSTLSSSAEQGGVRHE